MKYSAETISNNVDLLFQILLLLPTRTLIRFKCVSKQWLSFISDPEFAFAHLQHHRANGCLSPTVLFLREIAHRFPQSQFIPLKDGTDTSTKFPVWDFLHPSADIKHSCNGLVLYQTSDLMKPNEEDMDVDKVGTEVQYFVCNPTTRQFKCLSFPSCQFKRCVTHLYLVFDPLESQHFKVISIRKMPKARKRNLLCLDLYSSVTDTWSFLDIKFRPPIGMAFECGVYCNGVISWFSDDVSMLYFKVENEKLDEMPMPVLSPQCGRHGDVRYSGVSRGHVHLVMNFDSMSTKHFSVFEMEKDQSGWFLKYSFNLDYVGIRGLIWCRGLVLVLGVIRAEKEDESVILISKNGKVFSYKPISLGTKRLCDLKHLTRYSDLGLESIHLFETLAPLL